MSRHTDAYTTVVEIIVSIHKKRYKMQIICIPKNRVHIHSGNGNENENEYD